MGSNNESNSVHHSHSAKCQPTAKCRGTPDYHPHTSHVRTILSLRQRRAEFRSELQLVQRPVQLVQLGAQRRVRAQGGHDGMAGRHVHEQRARERAALAKTGGGRD